MSIHILSQNTINQIAAGEVVDRPSSVVKELVENAIDAGATSITVEIKDGGISFIRITDNGAGIPKDDIKTAFLRHATSKIKDAADLVSISSLGFRGEALSSISAIAQVELITKTKDSFTGIRYEIAGGMEKSYEEVGAPDGTTFIVRNLFYNTPARRKFLKTPSTEGGYINSLMEHLCMSHPEISFRFIQNNQPKIQTTGNGNLKDVIYTIFGRDITSQLVELEGEFEHFNIKGYIAKPVVSRSNRNFENYYINGRYIKSAIIMKAIENAYEPFMMQHKYPFTAFHINIEPDQLDVNVHPSKMELRFSNGQYIYECISQCITKALSQRQLIPDIVLNDTRRSNKVVVERAVVKTPESSPQKIQQNITVKNEAVKSEPTKSEPTKSEVIKTEVIKTKNIKPDQKISENIKSEETKTEQFKPETKQETLEPDFLSSETAKVESVKSDTVKFEPAKPARAPEPFEVKRTALYNEQLPKYEQLELCEQPNFLEKEHKKDIKIVGQVFDTYWIVEFEKNMYIIDQHAAHEKVLYEKFMDRYNKRVVSTQQLIPPIIIELTGEENIIIKDNLNIFTEFGFELEEFGSGSYVLRGIPADFTESDPSELFREILDSLTDESYKKTPDTIKNRIATMACKAAVKGNNRLSQSEASALINKLMDLENPYNCPHGRPTMITMSKYDLEKKFKRII